MADAKKLINLPLLQTYDAKLKEKVVGHVEIAGKTLTFKAVDGSVLGTCAIPETIYNPASGSADGLMSAADFTKLQGIAEGATKVESSDNGYLSINGVKTKVFLPENFTALAHGFYKITTNETGAVTLGEAVKKEDIVALGLPAQDTTYEEATASKAGLMAAGDKSKLDGIAAGATKVQESTSNGYLFINGTEVMVYEPDTQTELASGLYKFATNKYGAVTAGAAVTKEDLVALGLPAQDTTYALVTESVDGLMAAADKVKLDTVAQGAQANKLEGVSVNGQALPINSKNVNIDLTDYAKLSDISGVYAYKGSVEKFADLPTDAAAGDVYNVVAGDEAMGIRAGENFAWNGSAWDSLGGSFEIEVASTADIEALFA